MEYEILKNKIIIKDLTDFNVVQCFDCGQIFRFQIINNEAVVLSKNKKAKLITEKDCVIIETQDVEYFEMFFDLKTDYSKIKKQLNNNPVLRDAVKYGYGIRILNNDAFEMIVSFIISANNNISRIKKSIECLCEKFGSKCVDYYAFPTLEQLKVATVQDYKLAGLGYRAEQLYETIQRLTIEDIETLKMLTKDDQLKFLLSLKGVGEKVANCIMLFGLGVKNVFPVDTWINKVYNKINNVSETNRNKITKDLTEKYGNLSGYAQQYYFYYFRDNKLN